VNLADGDRIELRVTPDPYVTVRYAGASGDFNPIHIDDEFARSVGLPGRILHGLWMMAQVARAVTDAAGGPDPSGDHETLQSLSVSFRGMGRIGEEIVVAGSVEGVAGGVVSAKLDARQGETRLIRGAVAEARLPAGAGSADRPS
jgi:acyl dehydratase